MGAWNEFCESFVPSSMLCCTSAILTNAVMHLWKRELRVTNSLSQWTKLTWLLNSSHARVIVT